MRMEKYRFELASVCLSIPLGFLLLLHHREYVPREHHIRPATARRFDHVGDTDFPVTYGGWCADPDELPRFRLACFNVAIRDHVTDLVLAMPGCWTIHIFQVFSRRHRLLLPFICFIV